MAEIRKVDRHPAWVRWLLYPFGRALFWIVFTILGPFRVRGRYRIPKTGGLLIIANHLSDIDPIVAQLVCPRPIHFMAKRSLFEVKAIAGLMRICRAFPVDVNSPDRSALRYAVDLLRAGEVVCIFPEGQLSEDGELQELRAGVALIAKLAQPQVLCLGLTNTNRIMPYGKVTFRPAFGWVTVTWGDPRSFGAEMETDDFMDWATGQLRSLVE